MVSVPYEITLLSNAAVFTQLNTWFQYLMKLHYSQTTDVMAYAPPVFQYLMKLHYSQTEQEALQHKHEFQYLMKLHYSQTSVIF